MHHGPPATAVGIIVHLHLLVGGVGPDLVGADGDVSPLLGPAQDADVHHGVHGFREEGQNVDLHFHYIPSQTFTSMRPASRSTERMNTSFTAGIRISRSPLTV